MTIKQAFEKLYKAVKKAGMNPFFLIGNLKDTFKDVADNVVDGANVEVEPAQSSGYLVGNIKVNGEDNLLFAPQQVPPLHIYSDTERLVAVWFHDGISEDVYEVSHTEPTQIEVPANSFGDTSLSSTGIKAVINVQVTNDGGTCFSAVAAAVDGSSYVKIGNMRQSPIGVKTFIIRYTKNN